MAHRLPAHKGDYCTLDGVPGPTDLRPPGCRAAWNADLSFVGGEPAVGFFVWHGDRCLLRVGRASDPPERCITDSGWAASQEDPWIRDGGDVESISA